MSQALLRKLPSVSRILDSETGVALSRSYGATLTTQATRDVIDELRGRLISGAEVAEYEVTPGQVLTNIQNKLQNDLAPTLYPVINATGVIVHTNLGRATLSHEAQMAVQAAAGSYSTLEFDIQSGKRGSRSLHAQGLLQKVTGAEAGHIVNNTASAVLLMLIALCQGKEVIISRGQLVEIGGGFRVPDVMAQSGAKLVEVGTTNRTHLRDYANAITENTAAIMVAHHSNFKIVGFTTEPSLKELADLAHEHDLPLLYDQGSGCLFDTSAYGLEPEPTVGEGIDAGCDLITFSGDKLLGGPQAGLMIGRKEVVEACRKHPLARAVRPDKLCLAGLSATLTHYIRDEALTEIPVWRMISSSIETLDQRAQNWTTELKNKNFQGHLTVVDGLSTVGGGSLPGTTMPSRVLSLEVNHLESFAARLRQAPPHVIGRIQDNRLLFDPRTVLPEQDLQFIDALLGISAAA